MHPSSWEKGFNLSAIEFIKRFSKSEGADGWGRVGRGELGGAGLFSSPTSDMGVCVLINTHTVRAFREQQRPPRAEAQET